MEIGDAEEMLRLLDSSISTMKWKLRSSSKRRLKTDILALCTGLRAVIMVDYGGKMPELQDNLYDLLRLMRKEFSILIPLKVMVIEDMIYIVHSKGLAEHALRSLSLQPQLLFVDVEQDPPKMLLDKENIVVLELLAIQKLFSSKFSADDVNAESSECKAVDPSSVSEHTASQPFEIIDLSSTVESTQLTLPTLNGWLLGYPVVYLFRKDNAADSLYNLSVKSLNMYKIIVRRKQIPGRESFDEELMSFTVPCDLSLRMEKEPWAEAFLSSMLVRFERCRQVWADMRMEAYEFHSQSVVL